MMTLRTSLHVCEKMESSSDRINSARPFHGAKSLRHLEIIPRIAEKVDHVAFIGLDEQLQHGAA